jgi:hypothetical protein
MMKEVKIFNETLEAMASKSCTVEKKNVLFIADLHLGK